MTRRPFWQYLLLDWTRWAAASLLGFSVPVLLLHHLLDPGFLVTYITVGALLSLPFARRRWRRAQPARSAPMSSGPDTGLT